MASDGATVIESSDSNEKLPEQGDGAAPAVQPGIEEPESPAASVDSDSDSLTKNNLPEITHGLGFPVARYVLPSPANASHFPSINYY